MQKDKGPIDRILKREVHCVDRSQLGMRPMPNLDASKLFWVDGQEIVDLTSNPLFCTAMSF